MRPIPGQSFHQARSGPVPVHARACTKNAILWFIALLHIALFSTAYSQTEVGENPESDRRPLVLILHSHSASPWDNELQDGINHELIDPGKIDIYVDFMDAKKLETPEYLAKFHEVLKIKYHHIKFDLVIVCDETAYQYAKNNHEQLWPDTPVVFCGVNEFRPTEFSSLKNMTGISENTDLNDFVASFPKLLPRVKKFFIIRDDSTYSLDTYPHLMDALAKELPGIQTEEITNRLSAKELANRLSTLPADSAVFYLSFWRDSSGRIINRSEAQRIIQHSIVPVFTTHQSMMGNAATGICYVDAYDHGVMTGKLAKRILSGISPYEIPATMGPARRIAFDYEKLKQFKLIHASLPAGSYIFNEPFSFYRKYKKLVWSTSIAVAVLLSLVHLLAFSIIQRKRITVRLRESEEKFARAFFDAPVGMAIFSLKNGRCIEVNDRGLLMLGHTREQALNHSWTQIGLPSGYLDENPSNTQVDREIKIQRNDGQTLFCSYTSHTVKIGGRECMLVILIDLTSQKQSEAEREKLQAQLYHSQRMESIGRLAGGVAHDFNNMLTAIQINATQARQSISPDNPASRNLDEIEHCAQRSTAFTRRLLAFARKQTILPKVLDLNQTIEGSLDMLKRLIGERISIEWEPSASLWSTKLDPAQIDQILTNLCVNASDAISGNGRILITTKNATFDEEFCRRNAGYQSGEFVRLMVTDTGCGMNRKTLQRIFEPFFTTKEVGKGTGLGLATVYGIVRQNLGFILVDSEIGRGTSMRIYLPRHATAVEAFEQPQPKTSVQGGTETILLVEDEPSILHITQDALKKLGYTVMAASTPAEAMKLALEHSDSIDLLVTDIVMPEMNGRQLEARVRKLNPRIKSLFISGYTADVIVHEGILDEGINFLPKPFTVPEIAMAIRAALGELKPA